MDSSSISLSVWDESSQLDLVDTSSSQRQEPASSAIVPQETVGASRYREFIDRVLWNGGSSFDAWLNAASFQVSQVLLNLPFTFAQMGMASGITFQLLYGMMGSWVSYIMTSVYLTYLATQSSQQKKNHVVQWYEVMEFFLGPWGKGATLLLYFCGLSSGAMIQMVACASAAYYINDSLDKRTWTLVLGPFMFLGVLLPSPRNYRMWSFAGIIMTTYVAWYLTIAAAVHGRDPGVKHTGPHSLENYFLGASNIIYTFGGHGLTVELAGSMWKPRDFKRVYFYVVLYTLTLTLPSASTVYWAFGDRMLHNANAFAVLPRTKFRDAAVVLIIIHQFFEFGLLALPFFIMCEKLFGIHHSNYYLLKVAARIPVFLLIWFCAIMLPFFGPIDSFNGSFFTTLAVYFLPCLAHMIVFRSEKARKSSFEEPPFWIRSWAGMYCINLGVILWVVVVGVGIGGWATISNLTRQVRNFGLFARCYQCPPKS
ncbi:auxin transporter-like protein 1 [Selaginella moellendorffii]|uniref:auxin transporter-like protein 1 n=1 Tax=Selaginella moellendorffii TaxID=88036 RepID=UPI000D1CB009|nr:auxin transporter-like protein 1 [Selaginella moellendorffii]|eukprot:XP_024528202.1 auxin transporter-like protein 1 [Selaginella moellendorffii]